MYLSQLLLGVANALTMIAAFPFFEVGFFSSRERMRDCWGGITLTVVNALLRVVLSLVHPPVYMHAVLPLSGGVRDERHIKHEQDAEDRHCGCVVQRRILDGLHRRPTAVGNLGGDDDFRSDAAGAPPPVSVCTVTSI